MSNMIVEVTVVVAAASGVDVGTGDEAVVLIMEFDCLCEWFSDFDVAADDGDISLVIGLVVVEGVGVVFVVISFNFIK